ncbi:MAG: S8 family serine peptidase [Halothiobacillaceae bacterium]|nr:MAG: S8 family serine peptidase [Halothiobacillaceae bacterium]
MKTRLIPAALAAAALALAPPAMARPGERVTQIIVKPSDFHAAHAQRLSPAAMAPFVQSAGIGLEHVRSLGMQTQVLRLPRPMSVDEARAYAARLVADGVVLDAGPDARVYPAQVPNDPDYSKQWHFDTLVTGRSSGQNSYGLNLPPAWDVTTGGSQVVVALIDTGIRPHMDIDADILDPTGRVVPGHDFISDVPTANDGDGRDGDPRDPGDWVTSADAGTADFSGCHVQDSSWHGTHLAGLLAAATNNGSGVAAIDWNARLQPVRVLGKCGGLISDVIDGLRWAAGLPVGGAPANVTPARVLNISFNGFGPCGSALQAAIDEVRAQRAVLVVAAGNEGGSAASYFPGNCSGVINVTATDRQGRLPSYSNTGSVVTLAAPGGDDLDHAAGAIYSTQNDGTTTPGADSYAWMIGTSMATAHVSGVASLILAVNPGLGPDEVRDILRQTATPFPSYSGCTTLTCGAGMVRADTAVQVAGGYVPPPPPAPATDGGGGGSLGLLPLAGLAGLALLRRRQARPR